jgi:predicted DNA-binding transcriptional regulator AlpA
VIKCFGHRLAFSPRELGVSARSSSTVIPTVPLIKEETGTELSVSTFRGYVSRGQAPAPVEKIGRTPLWKRSEIVKWANNRPGQGARTDIRKPRRRRAE